MKTDRKNKLHWHRYRKQGLDIIYTSGKIEDDDIDHLPEDIEWQKQDDDREVGYYACTKNCSKNPKILLVDETEN